MRIMQLGNSLWQELIYGVLKRSPNIDFSDFPQEINFVAGYDEKNEVHYLMAPELPEFVATGKTSQELAKNVGDTLLVYFDVPTYFAKNYKDGVLTFTNQKTGENETVIVNKEELDRVLA